MGRRVSFMSSCDEHHTGMIDDASPFAIIGIRKTSNVPTIRLRFTVYLRSIKDDQINEVSRDGMRNRQRKRAQEEAKELTGMNDGSVISGGGTEGAPSLQTFV
ncbi:hypothetical protein KM043_014110 [Ampulex compressa]|nr:hypothetical protein KM043_014110 [Ampulex compressa]